MSKLPIKLLTATAAAAIGMVLASGSAQAATCTSDGYNVVATGVINNGITYDVLSGIVNNELWSNASACAGLSGGTLVDIESASQDTYVTSLLSTYSVPVAWIDLNGPNGGSAANYYWVDGAPMNYENWAGGFPTTVSGNAGDTTFGYIGGAGTWANANNDTFPSEDIGAIVVVPTVVTRAPEPASVAIFGAALFGAGFWGLRRRRKNPS